jgi:hypothetical protein
MKPENKRIKELAKKLVNDIYSNWKYYNEICEIYEDENEEKKKKFEYYFIQFFKKY